MDRRLGLLTFLILLAATTIQPRPARALDRAAVAAARRDLQSAVNHADPAALAAVRARFAAMSAAEPAEPLLHYWVAVATWRALPFQKDDKLGERMGDDALDHVEKGLAADPKFAELLAVKGALQGMVIRYKPGSMMTLGPQSGANLARAISMQPDNPRSHLLMGIGNFHKPAQFGGGPAVGDEEFQRAIEAFAKESVEDSILPAWGRDDAFLWHGRAAMESKDPAAAREAFRKALDVNPANGWVKSSLLPEAEKALAAKEK